MIEVLVFLFENYYQSENYPDQDTLSRKLHAAGFENEDISEALDWLNGLSRWKESSLPEALDSSSSLRVYATAEQEKLSAEARGFLAFLESARILTPLLRELIIERAMAIDDEAVGLDKFKIIVLIVLWTHRGNVDALILDELLPEGEKRQMH
jgi:Smg protein